MYADTVFVCILPGSKKSPQLKSAIENQPLCKK